MTSARNSLLVIVGLLLLWQLAYWAIGDLALRPPLETVVKAGALIASEGFLSHLAETLRAFALALAIAVVVGVALGFSLGMNQLLAGIDGIVVPGMLPDIPALGLPGEVWGILFVVSGGAAAFANLRLSSFPPSDSFRRWAHFAAGLFPALLLVALEIWLFPNVLLTSGTTLYRALTTALLPQWEQWIRSLDFLNLRMRFAATVAMTTWIGSTVVAHVCLLASGASPEQKAPRIAAFWLIILCSLLAGILGAEGGRRLAQALLGLISGAPARTLPRFALAEIDAVARFAEESAQVRRLHVLGSRLMQLDDTSALLDEILSAAIEVSGASRGSIHIAEADGAMQVGAQRGFAQALPASLGRLTPSDMLVHRALANRARVAIEDLNNTPLLEASVADLLRDSGVGALQTTPLLSGAGRVAGLLTTYYDRGRRPSQRDLRLLDLLARQAADLIERNRASHELRAVNEQLARANHDLEHFAYAASHDMQEPLRMITIYSEMLGQSLPSPLGEAPTMYLQCIAEGASRMRLLLTDLLAYAQVSGGPDPTHTRELVSLDEALDAAIRNCDGSLREASAIIKRGALPSVWGIFGQIVELFQNLISNAVKYRGELPPLISVEAVKEAKGWRITVRDNGIGIAPEYHERIFGVFKRLHGKAIPGTGIGLAICHRVVERHGGRIWVESRLGEGAAFCFTLPGEVVGAEAAPRGSR